MLHFETLRKAEFSRLDETDHAYLDYAAAGLHPMSSLQLHLDFLQTHVVSHPGTASPASTLASELLERARSHVLTFFNASPEEYAVVFTPSASSAAQLVGERYPFKRGSTLALLADNHSSVTSLRENARVAGASAVAIPLEADLRTPDITPHLRKRSRKANNLFAYPAQSNFSGVHHPLELINEAQELGYDVLLDAAAFVPANVLDLSTSKPDFVTISFYKMFGYPTGIGALLLRHKALRKLKTSALAGENSGITTTSRTTGKGGGTLSEEGFECYAVPNVLAMPAVLAGLQFLQGVDLEQLATHISILTGRLLRGLLSLRLENGRRAVVVYGPKTTIKRGGTVTFNILDPQGGWVDARIVQAVASARRVSLRVGCFENLGAADRALHGVREESSRDAEGMPKTRVRLPRSRVEGFYGAVRASLGIASNQADVDRLLAVVQGIISGGEESGKGESFIKKESLVKGIGIHRFKAGNPMSLLRKGEGRTASWFGLRE